VGALFSASREVDGWVFLAGQGGFREDGTLPESVEEQTDQALQNVARLLSERGCSLDDVVSCLVHLSDLGDLERYNAVYASHFAEPRPVRTTVGASLIGDMLVEITVVARRR
jgi:enamine deaminase RidA (YjgF/YER057c/UK114 family)